MKLQIVRLIAKLMGHRGLEIKEGKLFIWNVPMFFHCLELMPTLLHNSKDKKFITEIFYYIGKLQAFNGTNILIKRFGISASNTKTFMQLFIDQGIMLGLSKGEFAILNENKPHILFMGKVNFASKYKKMYGKQKEAVCHYMRGLIAGGLEAIFQPKDRLFVVEVKCAAKGDKNCVFEAKPESEWNNELFKKQYIPEPEYYNKLKELESLNKLLTNKK